MVYQEAGSQHRFLTDCVNNMESGVHFRPRGYKTFSCSTQLSMNSSLLINVKMPTRLMTGFDDLNLKFPLIVAILILMSSFNFILSCVEHENNLITSALDITGCNVG